MSTRAILALAAALIVVSPSVPVSQPAPPPTTDAERQHSDTLLRAFDQLMAGDAAAALGIADEVLAGDPDDLFARAIRGLSLMELGRPQEAEADADTLIAADPDEPGSWVLRARARLAQGKFDGSIADAGSALRVMPDHALALEVRGWARYQDNDPGGAVADFAASLAIDSGQASARRGLVSALSDLGRPEEALRAMTPWLEQAPDDPDLLAQQSGLLRVMGRYDGARAAADHALREDPIHADALYQRARLNAIEGRLEEARGDLNALVVVVPGNVTALVHRCIVRTRAGDPGAREDCEAASAGTAARPSDRALVDVAEAGLALIRGDLATARSRTAAALAANPREALAYWLDGLLRSRAGDADAARAAFAQARVLRPQISDQASEFFGPDLPRPAR